jgi:hypothetical protein
MNTTTTKTKLTALTILVTLAYCLLLFSSFTEGWDDFKLGFEEGYSFKLQTYFIDLKAKQSISSFPDSLTNIKTGKMVNIRYDKAQLRASVIPVPEKTVGTYQLIETLISLISIFIVIYIPVLFFKLMKSLTHEVVFDKKNIRYLRKIGLLLIGYYIVDLTINYISYRINVTLFDFADYTIHRESSEMIWLFLGFVLLLFAEILTKGSRIQEEQDLTI